VETRVGMWATGVPLVETTRGGRVESVHYGAVAVVDVQGEVKWSVGPASLVTFPRSSLKPLQLLALVARGGVERFGLQPDELAVMAGSHAGEPIHVDRVLRILQKIDAPASALACGVQTPLDSSAAAELTRAGGAPSVLHNNCSGKHAGMLALARLLGAPLENYIDRDHPAQVAIRECLTDLLQVDPAELAAGIDGCSAPAYALPLRNMARGFAMLGDPAGTPMPWRAGLHAISSAMRQHPELVAGTHGRVDTELMRLGRGLVAKSGAEGYFCVGRADGSGLALKVLDGDPAARARGVATVMAARRMDWIDDADLAGPLSAFGPRLPIRNLAGRHTGEVRPAPALVARDAFEGGDPNARTVRP
jgi:L-asparaginase II